MRPQVSTVFENYQVLRELELGCVVHHFWFPRFWPHTSMTFILWDKLLWPRNGLDAGPRQQQGNILAKDKKEECIFLLAAWFFRWYQLLEKCQPKQEGEWTGLPGPFPPGLTFSWPCLLVTGASCPFTLTTELWTCVAAICYLGHMNLTHRKKGVDRSGCVGTTPNFLLPDGTWKLTPRRGELVKF